MTTATEWWQGARPRTLGAAVSPVLVGTAAASLDGDTLWGRAAAALVVAVALQAGANYANDYSDGVRGTDADRRGPLRLTATGTASPTAVRTAAAAAFAVAAAVGAALSLVVDPRLLLVGAAALAAGALYTGGPRPYGYHGLGEVAVLVFFGFVATAGSAYVQVERVPAEAWWGALAVGMLAVAILVANNLRDLDGDAAAGKRTLAVRLGPARTRALYAAAVATSFVAVIAVGVRRPPALLGLLAAPSALGPLLLVRHRRDAPSLVAALVGTARTQLILAAGLAAGLWLS